MLFNCLKCRKNAEDINSAVSCKPKTIDYQKLKATDLQLHLTVPFVAIKYIHLLNLVIINQLTV